MKQLSKMMLAAVASVAVAAPAFAWDFSASGSASATWKQKSWKNYDNATAKIGAAGTSMNFGSTAGGISLKSSHTDGDASATLTYTVDYNGDDSNFDESFTVSGSKKVGDWTVSSSTTQHVQKDATATTGAQPMTANNTAAITMTNGQMTYVLGDATHVSTAEKTSSGGAVDGTVDAEARVGSFNGFSVGMKLSDTITGTFAIDTHSSTDNQTSAFGEGSSLGGASTGPIGQVVGYGFNVAASVGADISFTYVTASNTAPESNTLKPAATASTMGLGVSAAAGPATIALDYESSAKKTTTTATNPAVDSKKSGMELSVKVPLGSDSVVFNYSNQTTNGGKTGSATTADKDKVKTGMELEYATTVGAASLAVGYGTTSTTDADKPRSSASASDNEGYTTSEIGVSLSYSF